MNKQQFLAMSAITDLKGFVAGRSTHAGYTVYTLHSVPNKCKTVQIAASMNEDEFYVDIDKFKPILHPLSDFTKEIEHKGEKFVPIDKLLGNFADGFSIMYNENKYIQVRCNRTKQVVGISFSNPSLKQALKLIEWHFDLAHLIEKGDAIDVNTLDINPYK